MTKLDKEALSFQKCHKINDPLDTYVSEKVAILLAKPFIKHRITPNVVTMFSLILGIIGPLCFLPLSFFPWWVVIIGIAITFLSYCFDCADGMVARATHRGSLFGRCFDGFSDSIVYASIYICISIRLFFSPIPFTNVNWSFWIFFISLPVGLYFHVYQARVADYYKNVYMYITGGSHCELSQSKNISKEVEALNLGKFSHFICASYSSYTKSQEKLTPNFQKLRARIEENGGVIPEKVRQLWLAGTNHSILFTNALVFNFRTYILFALLLCEVLIPVAGLCFWIFPVNIFVFEVIKIILLVKYEKLAKICLEKGFED